MSTETKSKKKFFTLLLILLLTGLYMPSQELLEYDKIYKTGGNK
jgi:hypothetical protein